MFFANRIDAGRRLAARLSYLRGQDVVVLGLPRGGVPVAFEVARALEAPLDVLVVRKLGVPFQAELAMGAIGEGGVRVLNNRVLADASVTADEMAEVERAEREVLERRLARFRGDRVRVPLEGRTALVVDDGIATGSTARAACQVARALGAARVVLAAPVGPPNSIPALGQDADEVILLETPAFFFAIGQFYADFSQTSDEEVVRLLIWAATPRVPSARASVEDGTPAAALAEAPAEAEDPPARGEEIEIPTTTARLAGNLSLPEGAPGLVVFAHGSGSGRHSPRNRFVASVLAKAGLGTLLFDLLTPDEEHDRALVFDVELLARRLTHAHAWLRRDPRLDGLPVGYFGASTGAAAALWAAAEPDADVAAVVSRGGRPDLAASRLARVHVPTLLVVGGRDTVVLDLNRQAQQMLGGESRLAVVRGATHLFEEPGALPVVADLARDWFVTHLTSAPRRAYRR
ncbi:MAG: phosphoribosyltransferase family protein [Actinomycetes bacterium]